VKRVGYFLYEKNYLNNFFCLVCTDYGKLTKEQLEAARRVIRRKLKKKGVLVIRAFSYLSFTKKPLQVRMGKGKGRVEGFVCPTIPGKILFELRGVPAAKATEALRSGSQKLSLRTVIKSFKETYN